MSSRTRKLTRPHTAMLCLHPATALLHGSPAVLDMLDGAVQEALSLTHFLNLVHPLDREQVQACFDQAAQGVPYIDFAARLMLHKEVRHVRYVAHASHPAGEGLQYLGVLTDDTEQQRQSQEILRLQRQIEALSQISSRREAATAITHEIRQPLTAIGLSAGAVKQWLRQAQPDLAEVDAAVQQVQHDVARVERILRNADALMAG
jgi:signal transduction histidine kinase